MRSDVLRNVLATIRDPSRLIMIAANYDSADSDRRVWARDPVEVAKALGFTTTFNDAQAGAALYEYRFLGEDQFAPIRSALGFAVGESPSAGGPAGAARTAN